MNNSQRYYFACHTPTEEIQEIPNPRNKYLAELYVAAFETAIAFKIKLHYLAHFK